MSAITKRIYVGGSDEAAFLGDSPMYPFVKGVRIYAHKYSVANGDYAAGDSLVAEFDGAQKILFCHFRDIVGTASAPELAHVNNGALTGTDRQGLYVTTGTTNASSTEVELFAIVQV